MSFSTRSSLGLKDGAVPGSAHASPVNQGRILHVPRRFVAHEWGGTETVVASLAFEQQRRGWRPEVHTSLALTAVRQEEWNGLPVRRYAYSYPFFGLNAAQKAQMDKKGGNLLSLPLFFALARAKNVRIFHAHALKRLGGKATPAKVRRQRGFYGGPSSREAVCGHFARRRLRCTDRRNRSDDGGAGRQVGVG